MGDVPDSGDLATAEELLALAVEAVLEAGAIQCAHLDSGFTVATKGLADVVTSVDVAIEAAFRDLIARRLPGHCVLGEEMANEPAPVGVPRWLFDPIDG